MDGTIKITCVLHNPDGVWQDEMEVEAVPPEELRRLLLTALQRLRVEGMTRFPSDTELDSIPMARIKQINIRFEEKRVQLGTPGAVAAATGRLAVVPPRAKG